MTPGDPARPGPAGIAEVASAIPAVRLSAVSKSFGQIEAVREADLSIPRGAIFGLIGPDGAGKSTLFRMVATLLAPSTGSVEILGLSVSRHLNEIVRHLGYMSQQFCMYRDLSVGENLEFFAGLRGVNRSLRRTRQAELLERMGMAQFAGRAAGLLSGGMKQKLMLACVLMHEPELLILDEPTTGVDPLSRKEFWEILDRLHKAGRTIVIATPYMEEAARCSQVAFISEGRITHQGTPDRIRGLVRGTLVEVVTDAPRDALAAIESEFAPTMAHLLGDRVRILFDGHGSVPVSGTSYVNEVGQVLTQRGFKAAAAEIKADMEEAFAYLSQEDARAADVPEAGVEPCPR